ncbi:protein of unknown function [Candidatus Nitrotoga arctica]|uniref:Uncharacterized protein n=1 Tax=Candidatus Nitrotoga arctica TaxID=453162 RepID=A0ABM8YV13_9PROT|nr:protein of unknown function [Candidatus Nitrotoga arctica]
MPPTTDATATLRSEKKYSFTETAFLGMRPWAGGELYFNPEIVQDVPLSNLTRLGGLTIDPARICLNLSVSQTTQ